MKIVRFKINNQTLWGKLNENQTLIDTNIALTKDIVDFSQVAEFFEKVQRDKSILTDEISRMDAKLLAPVLPTKNILCIGKNYHDHILI